MPFKQEKIGNSQHLIQAMANLESFGDYIYYLYIIGNNKGWLTFHFMVQNGLSSSSSLGPQGPGCYELDVPLLGYERRSPWGMPKRAWATGWPHGISVKMKGKQDMNGKYWYLRVDGSEISNNRLGCIKPCK